MFPSTSGGEGSFDKGIIIKAPLNWFTGKKSRSYANAIVKPITGDGGAKLHLSDEKYLYDQISGYSRKNILDNFTRVYR